jgi:hypothetical protein
MPQQEVIKLRTHYVIRKGRLTRGGLKREGTTPTALIVIIKSGARIAQEASLPNGLVAALAIKDGQVRWQERFPNMKPREGLPLKHGNP